MDSWLCMSLMSVLEIFCYCSTSQLKKLMVQFIYLFILLAFCTLLHYIIGLLFHRMIRVWQEGFMSVYSVLSRFDVLVCLDSLQDLQSHTFCILSSSILYPPLPYDVCLLSHFWTLVLADCFSVGGYQVMAGRAWVEVPSFRLYIFVLLILLSAA